LHHPNGSLIEPSPAIAAESVGAGGTVLASRELMPRTVLLVDENAAVLADLRRVLDGSPYRVLSARGLG